MKRLIPVLLVLVLLVPMIVSALEKVERREDGNLVIEGIPEIPQTVKDRMFQYQNTRGAGVRGWAADGSGIYIGTRFGETSQIHFVKKPGGARNQITFFNEPVGGASVSPDPSKNGFLFGKDVGGGGVLPDILVPCSHGQVHDANRRQVAQRGLQLVERW